jgi:uncharacterized protein (DUF952 family)
MILHITTNQSWDAAVATGSYRDVSLEDEGFIHCSTVQQILGPANEFYRGQSDLVLLCISSSAVEAEIIYEDCYETGMAYPHIYGPLNVSAVKQVVEFPPNADGSFSLPSELEYQYSEE